MKEEGLQFSLIFPCCPAGWRGSFGGDLHMYGKAGVHFFTQPKTVTTNWKDLDDVAGGRASGLDGVGAATASNVKSGP